MKVKGTLKQIVITAKQVEKLETVWDAENTVLLKELNRLFEQWKNQLNNLPFLNSTQEQLKGGFYILKGMEWLYTKNATVCSNGSLHWTYTYCEGDADIGKSKVGEWMYCTPEKKGTFPFEFKEIVAFELCAFP